MKIKFPPAVNPQLKVRPPLPNMKIIDELLRSGEKGLIALHKLLRPEKEGGISQKEKTLRKQIWDTLLAHSFGGPGNVRILEKDRLPYSHRLEHIRALGHVLLRGRLNSEGRLEAGKNFTRFDEYGQAEYLLEMNEGSPVRLFMLGDNSMFEFFPIIDNKTGKVVDVHRGKIKREKLLELGDFTTYTYLGRGEGALLLGGYRPKINGQSSGEHRPWAKFTSNPDEKVKVVVKDGILRRCTSLESGLDEEFALVWDKTRSKYVTSFWGGMYEDEFNQLRGNHEIHNCLLSRDGSLFLGGKEWMDFGVRYRYHRVRITGILNPSGRKAFIAAAEVMGGNKVLAAKKLSQTYEIQAGSPHESFERGELLNVFEKWSADKLLRADGTKPYTYLLTGISTNSSGELTVGIYWGRFSRFPNASVEAKVINGRPALVRFVTDRKGEPILDIGGSPLILDLSPGIERGGGTGIKHQVETSSMLVVGEKLKAKEMAERARESQEKWQLERRLARIKQRKMEKLSSLCSEGTRLHEEGKPEEARRLFKRVLRIVSREPSMAAEMNELAEKAKKYLELLLEARPKAEPKSKPKAEPKPKPKMEPKPKPAPKPTPEPTPVATADAKPKPKTRKFESGASSFLNAMSQKGASLDWIAQASGVSPKRILLLMEGFTASKDEIIKIRGAYLRFAIQEMKKKK